MPAAKATANKVVDAVAKVAKNAAAAATTRTARKEKKAVAGGLGKVFPVSPTLKKFLGVGESSRVDTTKKIWAYIKDHGLQDPENKRHIVCDEKLKQVLGQDRVTFAEMSRLLNVHFPKKEDGKS